MSADGPGTHTFLPWSRAGLASYISTVDAPGADLPGRATLPVGFTARHRLGELDGATFEMELEEEAEISPDDTPVRVYGPGDVVGLDARQVIRTEPSHRSRGFEVGYYPAVEFARPDLPWLFTPARADSEQRLRPWLCLVTVAKDRATVTADPDKPQPVLRVHERRELQDLSDSWLWAHVQVTGAIAGESLAEIARSRPDWVVSRLLCPRSLEPDTDYLACVVPAFAAGRRAGLGEPADADGDEGGLDPAWTQDGDGDVLLPVYYHWEFATGEGGDFRSLVRQLRPRPLSPGTGLRPLDISAPGFGGEASVWQSPLALESALQAPGTQPVPWHDEARKPFQTALVELLDAIIPLEQPDQAEDPVVGPPIYGRWHAGVGSVPDEDHPPRWLGQLNRDPHNRAAAGFGALVICREREALMASAWDQVRGVSDVNRLLNLACLGRAGGEAAHTKWLQGRPDDVVVAFTAPAHARVAVDGETVRQAIAGSRVPEALLSPALRRLLRPGPLRRRLYGQDWRTPRRLLRDVNDGLVAAAGPRGVPDGTVRYTDPDGVDVGPDAIIQAPPRSDFAVAEQWGEEPPGYVQIAVPDVVEQPRADTADALHEAGLGVEEDGAYSELVDEGHVISTDPPTGTMVALGTVVTIVISLGPPPTPVPDVVPLELPAALDILEQAGFDTEMKGVSSFITQGLVVRTEPQSGEIDVPDNLVIVYYSTGSSGWDGGGDDNGNGEVPVDPGNGGGIVIGAPLQGEGERDDAATLTAMAMTAEQDNDVAAAFRAAALGHEQYRTNAEAIGVPVPGGPVDLAALAAGLLAQTDPAWALPRRIHHRLRLPSEVRRGPDPLGPVKAYPTFPQPMYEPLADIDESLLLAGVDKIKPNTVALLESNPRFIEAYMVGLNHEMGRVLLWRGYPTDQRGTYFSRFWDSLDGDDSSWAGGGGAGGDIPPIHTWPDEHPLGANKAGAQETARVVLCVRGELLRRYPGAMIYAVRAVWDDDIAGLRPDPAAGTGVGDEDDARLRQPAFRGQLGSDLVYLGFALDAATVAGDGDPDGDPGWFFVIAEQPSEPRFGPPSGAADAVDAADAAKMAHATLRAPVRMALHASRLVSREA